METKKYLNVNYLIVSLLLKTLLEFLLVAVMFTVGTMMENVMIVQKLNLVLIYGMMLGNSLVTMMPMVTKFLTITITQKTITQSIYQNNVIIFQVTSMDPLLIVNQSNVLLKLKMNGELLLVQVMVNSIVQLMVVHLLGVKTNTIVMTSMIPLNITCPLLILLMLMEMIIMLI